MRPARARPAIADHRFAAELATGLGAPRKSFPTAYLYDERGSELFERVASSPSYSLARDERALLAASGGEVRAEVSTAGALIEFGAGDFSKTRLLLDPSRDVWPQYVPIDVSPRALAHSLDAGAAAGLVVTPIRASFFDPVRLPPNVAASRLGFFPGNTLGNFSPAARLRVLTALRETLGPGNHLLVTTDSVKPDSELRAAYDSPELAALLRNGLARAAREFGLPLDPAHFDLRVEVNDATVYLFLESRRALGFAVADRAVNLRAGERILMAISRKFTTPAFARLAHAAGFNLVRTWADAGGRAGLHLLLAPPRESA